MSKNCTKKRTVRAAQLSFLIQPIKPLICGVVVAFAVVISCTLLYWGQDNTRVYACAKFQVAIRRRYLPDFKNLVITSERTGDIADD